MRRCPCFWPCLGYGQRENKRRNKQRLMIAKHHSPQRLGHWGRGGTRDGSERPRGDTSIQLPLAFFSLAPSARRSQSQPIDASGRLGRLERTRAAFGSSFAARQAGDGERPSPPHPYGRRGCASLLCSSTSSYGVGHCHLLRTRSLHLHRRPRVVGKALLPLGREREIGGCRDNSGRRRNDTRATPTPDAAAAVDP